MHPLSPQAEPRPRPASREARASFGRGSEPGSAVGSWWSEPVGRWCRRTQLLPLQGHAFTKDSEHELRLITSAIAGHRHSNLHHPGDCWIPALSQEPTSFAAPKTPHIQVRWTPLTHTTAGCCWFLYPSSSPSCSCVWLGAERLTKVGIWEYREVGEGCSFAFRFAASPSCILGCCCFRTLASCLAELSAYDCWRRDLWKKVWEGRAVIVHISGSQHRLHLRVLLYLGLRRFELCCVALCCLSLFLFFSPVCLYVCLTALWMVETLRSVRSLKIGTSTEQWWHMDGESLHG